MRCAGVSVRRRCELQVGQMSIKRRIDNQFLMRAGGRYLTVVDQQNAISPHHRGQPVRNDKGGSVA